MFYTQEQIDRANQADLVSFLQSQGETAYPRRNEYRWKRHDSLTVRGSKWYRHSQSKGGGPVDFVMEFFGKSFTEAVELLTGEKGAAPAAGQTLPRVPFRLSATAPNNDNRIARNYLTAARRIDEDVTGFFLPAAIFTRTQPTTTPYSWGGTRTDYRATPTARERRETSGLM